MTPPGRPKNYSDEVADGDENQRLKPNQDDPLTLLPDQKDKTHFSCFCR